MTHITVFALILLSINLSQQLTMHCDFKEHSTDQETKYACVVTNLTTTFKDRRITEVVGNHKSYQSHNNVKKLFIKFQNIPYLPHNVGEFFPNLEAFYVTKSNVQHLISGDLDGLDKLIHFDVSHNPVELIEKDFLKNHKKLTKISFHDCHLKKIETGAFDGLSSLTLLNLNYNDCVSKNYESFYSYSYRRVVSISEFLTDVYDKCTGAGRLLKVQETIVDCAVDQPEPVKSYGSFLKFGIPVICFLSSIIVFLIIMIFIIRKRTLDRDFNEVSNKHMNGN